MAFFGLRGPSRREKVSAEAKQEAIKSISRVIQANPEKVIKEVLRSFAPRTQHEALNDLDLAALIVAIKDNPAQQRVFLGDFLQSPAVLEIFYTTPPAPAPASRRGTPPPPPPPPRELIPTNLLDVLDERLEIELIDIPGGNVETFFNAFFSDNPNSVRDVMSMTVMAPDERVEIMDIMSHMCSEFAAGKLAVRVPAGMGPNGENYLSADQFLARLQQVHYTIDRFSRDGDNVRGLERLEEQIPEAKELDDLARKVKFSEGDLPDMIEGYKKSFAIGVADGTVPVKEVQAIISDLLGTLKRFDVEEDAEKKKSLLNGFIQKLKGGIANLAALGGLALTAGLMWTALASFYLPVWLTMKMEKEVGSLLKH